MSDARNKADFHLAKASHYNATYQESYSQAAIAFVYAVLYLADQIGEEKKRNVNTPDTYS